MAVKLKANSIKVFSPATVANVGCGFDIFGFAVNTPGDELSLRITKERGVRIKSIKGDKGLLPLDSHKNTAGVSALKMLEFLNADFGVIIKLTKQMPLSSGLGSSAASAVASVFALNNLLKKPLSKYQLLKFAIEGEKIACGENLHFDNISACLFGGFVLIRSIKPIEIISIPTPKNFYCTLIHPKIEIKTSDSRKSLNTKIQLNTAVSQWANTAGVIAALYKRDLKLFKNSMQDNVIEPQRKKTIPFFDQMKESAFKSGAFGFGISGSGPSVFVLCPGIPLLKKISKDLSKILLKNNIQNDVYISKINKMGPKILKIN